MKMPHTYTGSKISDHSCVTMRTTKRARSLRSKAAEPVGDAYAKQAKVSVSRKWATTFPSTPKSGSMSFEFNVPDVPFASRHVLKGFNKQARGVFKVLEKHSNSRIWVVIYERK